MADYISNDPNAGMEEQKQYLSTDPNFGIDQTPQIGQIASNAGQAAVETAKEFIPKNLGEVLGFVTPIVGAAQDVGHEYGMLKDVLFGKPIEQATAESFPETQIIPEAEKTPPYSKERFKAGFGGLAQMGMAALGVKALARPQIPETPVSDTALPKQEVVPETPATVVETPPEGQSALQDVATPETGARPVAEPESITAAAVKYQDGEIKTGVTHAEITGDHAVPTGAEDGFVTNTGRFVDAKEAHDIAVSSRQAASNKSGVLLAEDLSLEDTGSKPVAPVSEPTEPQTAQPKVNETVKSVFEKYDSGDEKISTPRDVAAELDGVDGLPPELQKSIDDFNDAVREDREVYGERGGLEEDAGDKLISDIQNHVEPTPVPKANDATTVKPLPEESKAEPTEPITYSEGRTTGIAQRITNVPANEGLTVQESVDRGQNLLSEGVNPEEVSARVKTTKQLSVDDLSVLRARTSELDKAAYAAEDAFRANPNDLVAKQNWEQAVKARTDWNTEHVKPAQTIWSDLGRTQQGEADIDTGTVTGLRVAFNEAKGRDPTPAEQAKLTDYADKTRNIEGQIDQAKSRYDQAIGKESGAGGVPTVEQLQERFLSKIDPDAKSFPFTQGEISDLWKYTKAAYIDKGVTSLDDTIHMVALDTGLRPEWVADALTKPKAIKQVTNELYSAMSKRRDIVSAAKDYIRAKDEPLWKKVAKSVWETPFSLAIYGHGTVGGITHAGANIFRPSVWSAYWPDFVNQAKFFVKPGIHEAAMQRLVRGENYITAKRAGLANDPNLTYTDYGAYAKFFGLQGGRRGFDALKTMRQSMFDSLWSKVPDTIKSDSQASKELAKGYADMVNHATGVISNTDRGFLGTSARAMGPLMFAAKLEASRWARVIGDPVKTLDTYAQWNKATPAEKAIAVKRTKNAAEFVAGFLGTLYLNQAILSASGSKDKINFSDPSKSDWLKHKIAGHTVAVDGGLLAPIRLLGRLTYDTLIRPRKELRGDTRTAAAIKDVGQYAIGKASPSIGIAKEAVTGESFEGRLLPWSRDTSKKPKMTWPEYAASRGPIPISGGIRDVYDSMRDRGMSSPDAKALLRGLAAFGSELTGARVMEFNEPAPKKAKNR